MAKIVVECRNPNDPDEDEVESIMDQIAGRCNITYFKQHQGMIEAGTSKSKSESARIIAEDTGETPQTVRHRIQRGEKESVHVGQKNPNPEPPEITPNLNPQNNNALRFFNMHQALNEIGRSKNQAQSAEIIFNSNETGESQKTIEVLISKGKRQYNLDKQKKEAKNDECLFKEHQRLLNDKVSDSIDKSSCIIAEREKVAPQIIKAKIQRGKILSDKTEKNNARISPYVTVRSALNSMIKINKYLIEKLEFPFKKEIPKELISKLKDEINLLKIILTQIEGEQK